MTQNAANRSRENVNAWSGQEVGTLDGLLEKALIWLLRANDDGTIDVQVYEELVRNAAALTTRVHGTMKNQRAVDATSTEITDEQIHSLDSQRIRAQLLSFGISLESQRQQTMGSLMTLVRPSVFQNAQRREKLKTSLKSLSIEKLQELMRNEDKGRHFLKGLFTGTDVLTDEHGNSVHNFLSDHGVTIDMFGNAAQQKAFSHLLHLYLGRHDFTHKDRKELIAHIARVTNASAQRKLLTSLIPVINLEILEESPGIMNASWKWALEKGLLKHITQLANIDALDLDATDEYTRLLKQKLFHQIRHHHFDTATLFDIIEALQSGSTDGADALAARILGNKVVSERLMANFWSTLETARAVSERETGMKLIADAEGSFLASFQQHLTNAVRPDKKTKCLKDPNQASELKTGSWIVVRHRDRSGAVEQAAYYHIDAAEVRTMQGEKLSDGSNVGVTLSDFSPEDGLQMLDRPSAQQGVSYETLKNQLLSFGEIEIISDAQMTARKKDNDPNVQAEDRISVAPPEAGGINSIAHLKSLFDGKIDQDGSDISFEEGMVFEMAAQRDSYERDFSKHEQGIGLWRITSITNDVIQFSDAMGIEHQEMKLPEYAAACESMKVYRVGKFKTFSDFKDRSKKAFGWSDWEQLDLVEGKLVMKKTDGKQYEITSFVDKDEQRWDLRIKEAKDGYVSFWRITDKGEEPSDSNGNKGKAPKGEPIFKVPYEMLFLYLRNYKATTIKTKSHDIENHDHDDHGEHEPHTHGGLWSWYMSNPSIGELWKSFSMGKHAFDHMLETRSELGSLRWARRWSKYMPPWLLHHIEHEHTTKSTAKIDELAKHIEALSPFKLREDIIHILHDQHASFEHVHAALLVAGKKWGGHLYWEELRGMRGDWLYFRALCRVYRLPYAKMKERCLKKAKETYAANQTEENAIEMFFKLVQGLQGDKNSDSYKDFKHTPPMPSDMISKYLQGIGDGRKNGKEGGQRNALQRLEAKDRTQLAWDKMYTKEYAIVSGILPTINHKSWDPKLNGAWWGFAMSGAMDELHGEMANELKNFAEDKGHTFHAVPFLRDPQTVKIYQDAVYAVAEKVFGAGSSELRPLQKMAEIRAGHYETHDEGRNKEFTDAMKGLKAFWEKHYGILNPYLQLDNGYIRANQHHPALGRYFKYLKGSEKDWDRWVWWGTPEGGKGRYGLTKDVSEIGMGLGQFHEAFGDFYAMVHTCSLTETKWGMATTTYKILWQQCMRKLDHIKNMNNDEEFPPDCTTDAQRDAYKKEIFVNYHGAIFEHLKRSLEVNLTKYEGQDYMNDLKRRGFTIHNQTPLTDKEGVRRHAEQDYKRFMNGDVTPSYAKMTQSNAHKLISDDQFVAAS